jgi:hypothetical protein
VFYWKQYLSQKNALDKQNDFLKWYQDKYGQHLNIAEGYRFPTNRSNPLANRNKAFEWYDQLWNEYMKPQQPQPTRTAVQQIQVQPQVSGWQSAWDVYRRQQGSKWLAEGTLPERW